MGMWSELFRRAPPATAERATLPALMFDTAVAASFEDPAFLEWIRSGAGGGGAATASGVTVSPQLAMRNTTVLRCVSLVAFSIGMLPLFLQERDTRRKASEHPLFKLLHRRPNAWQTAFEFRSLMQQRALVHGDAFAQIVRSGSRILALVPIANDRVVVEQTADWTLRYKVRNADGANRVLRQADVFHIRYGMSDDGYTGLSLVKQAAEAIGLATQAERSAARLFRNGVMAGLTLKHPGTLSPEAFERLRASLDERAGAENAHRSMILEDGLDIADNKSSARDAQAIEQRTHQIEEIARPFGVPRPLLGVDDTSWGSGIDVLGQFFVRYGLNPWFEAWQQAVERDLLSDGDVERYEAKFNAGALLRGSMKDQAEFFAKGLGSGGHAPFLAVDEVRGWLDLGHSDDLPPQPGQTKPTTGGAA